MQRSAPQTNTAPVASVTFATQSGSFHKIPLPARARSTACPAEMVTRFTGSDVSESAPRVMLR